MNKKHDWVYSSAPGCWVGLMICTACNKPITSGQFRYRLTKDGYLPQHRACSAADKKWARLDGAAQRAAEYEAARLAAFREFVAKWGLPDDLVENWSDES